MMLGPVSSENEGAGSGIGRVRAFSLVIRAWRQWRQKLTRMAIPAHPCIFCGGLEEV